MPIERLVSAGGVLVREINGETETVLCGRPSTGLWGLPKGTPNSGETLKETALREVEEETGIRPRIEGKIGTTQYRFKRSQDKARCFKTVHYYLMTPVLGDTSLHDAEYEEVIWCSIAVAIDKLSHENDVQILKLAVDMAARRGVPKQ
ncbi:MAG: NUDIX hydrolase [Dehalococcoidia bacterium]|nr:NUDIX hydrolase [Dehalococcoidia bacterium]